MKIKSITQIEDNRDYLDITVEGTHNFVLANGSVVHNCGTGVGFSVESHQTNKLPEVPDELHEVDDVIVVADSKIGWASSFRRLINALYGGSIPNWDVSKVRPSGSPLKTFGGRASGPEPLVELFEYTVDLFKKAKGRKLAPIECHGLMCKVAEIVIVGGTRRSALISLSDLQDDRMRKAKSGQWWDHNPEFRLANNSAAYLSKPSPEEFLSEWQSLIESKSGERGIINRKGLQKKAAANGRRDPSFEFGMNPSLVAGTKVWTQDGVKPIQLLEGKTFKVKNLNGDISDATCWQSGTDEEVIEITLSGGHKYLATPKHRWPVWDGEKWVKKNTSDLVSGDLLPNLIQDSISDGTSGTEDEGFVIGWNLGDGWITERKDGKQIGFIVSSTDRESGIDQKIDQYLKSLGSKACILSKDEINVNNKALKEIFAKYEVTHKSNGLPSSVWKAETSEEFREALIDGLFSSDGSVERDSARIQLSTAHQKLAEDVSSLLGFYGIKSSIQHSSSFVTFNNNAEKEYFRFNVRITGYENVALFANKFKLTHKGKQDRINNILNNKRPLYKVPRQGFIEIKSLKTADKKYDVWDISVNDDTHCFQIDHTVTGNCGEISLRDRGLCNLSEVVIRAEDTMFDVIRKVRLATILGTLQSTFTDFRYLSKDWKKNAEEERLLGVSLTGIYDNELFYTPGKELEKRLEELKQVAIDTNAEWAEKLGINASAAITCVKPSGTAGKLADAANGIHPRFAKYYINTNRLSANDPVAQLLQESGVVNEPDITDPKNTIVFSYPQKAPDGAKVVEDVSALDQLELWMTYSKYWCEHNPSITVYVKDDEWVDVAAYVYKNFDDINGISFLPKSDHTYKQAPFQEISKEEYEELESRTPSTINWDLLAVYEFEDRTEGSQELACSGVGGCEIDVDLDKLIIV